MDDSAILALRDAAARWQQRRGIQPWSPDSDVWKEREGGALYVHGLVIDRALSGQGVGAALLHWVEPRAQQLGKQWVRLDCAAANERLRNYYLRHGFEVVGSKSSANDWLPVVLLEKCLPQLAPPSAIARRAVGVRKGAVVLRVRGPSGRAVS